MVVKKVESILKAEYKNKNNFFDFYNCLNYLSK